MQDSTDHPFLSKIKSPYQAEAIVRDASKALYVVAAAHLLSAAVQGGYELFIASALNALCGYFVGRHKSRLAALFALALALAIVGWAVHNHVLNSGTVLFTLLSILAGARSLEATSKLRRGFPEPRKAGT
jgi:NhaP-type Na+/H+ and K+/H+ antiporter